MECHNGVGHAVWCDEANGIRPDHEPDPDPVPDPDLDPDPDPEPGYDTNPETDGHDGAAAPAVGGRGGEMSAERMRRRVLMRGEYVTFTEYFHGEGAVGVMSIMDNRAAPGLTSWAALMSCRMRMT
jgi:hypothetical protein